MRKTPTRQNWKPRGRYVMSSTTGRTNGVYDPLPTDGDPHESVDEARRPLAFEGLVLSDQPLDESGKPNGIGEGEGKVLHPGDTDYESMRHEQAKKWYVNARGCPDHC